MFDFTNKIHFFNILEKKSEFASLDEEIIYVNLKK